MKIIQSHPTFYVELSPGEILIYPKRGIPSSYPIWLGKNRAVMKDAIKYFEKHPPQSVNECLGIVGHFGLNGVGATKAVVEDFFAKDEKSLDNDKVFW